MQYLHWLVSIGYALWGAVWWQGWQALKDTTLRSAWLWLGLAWLVWTIRSFGLWPEPLGNYLGLCGSALVVAAVLGARRPGADAWNLVVLCLAGVLCLPAGHASASGWLLEIPWAIFLIGLLTFGLINYLPTGLAAAMVFAGTAHALAAVPLVMELSEPIAHRLGMYADAVLVPALWLGWILTRRRAADAQDFQSRWRLFRDRFGLVWALRVQEQFRAAARHRGLPYDLTWRGLVPTAETACTRQEEAERLVHALLQRFQNG
ncbi:MAG: hypothetical protein C4297_12435 [Gemmataceae bacterium]